MTLPQHDSGLKRCAWCGSDPFYQHYHDTDWGVPEYDSRALFEKLILDGFQAGLSWITILRKRENFRKSFDGFNPAVIARYDDEKQKSLMQDTGIVRNRLKIAGTIASAKACLAIPDFSTYLWDFVDGVPLQNQFQTPKAVPTKTPLAEKLSKDLKRRGFKFVGPTIVYAFMQATGFVNDHLVSCHRHEAVKKLVR